MAASLDRSFTRQPIAFWLCSTAILLLAALLRIAPIRSGLPYSDYVDEGYVLHQTISLLNHRSLNTQWYGYPSLPAYLTSVTLIAYGPIYRYSHGHTFQKDLPSEASIHTNRGDKYDLISPPELLLAGRVVAVCLSIGTVILTGAIATLLFGNTTGLLALLISAVCPALVIRASNVIVDTFATFFALLSLYFCERLRQSSFEADNSKCGASAVYAGLAAGLAFASKYTAVAVFVAAVPIIVTLPVKGSARVRLSLLASAGLFLGIAVAAPVTLLKSGAVFREIAATAHNYTTIKSSPGFFGQAVTSFELGWPLVVVGCTGLVMMLRRKSTRWLVISWLLFAGLLFGFFIAKPFQPFRNLLPLVPLFCIAGAFFVTSFIQWTRHGRYRIAGYVGTILAVFAILGSLGYFSTQYLRQRIAHRDARVQAIEWLRTHTQRADRVVALDELAILPAEWQRVDASISVVPWLDVLNLLRHQTFDYLVAGEFDPRINAEARALSYQKSWKSEVSSLPIHAKFGRVPTPLVPYFWRTNDERIIIFETKKRKGLNGPGASSEDSL